MTVPFSGGCACGALRYTCTAEPIVSYACHCTACQKRTGSAFGVSLRVATDTLSIDRGTPREGKRTANSGNTVKNLFCGDCGGTIISYGDARPHMRVIPAGTLDDPTWVPIQANIWTDSALPWVHLDPAIEKFPSNPDPAKLAALSKG